MGNWRVRMADDSKGETHLQTYPLHLRSGLMFLEHGGLWLIDTGSPTSFSARESIELDGARFGLERSLLGYTADRISELVGFEIAGLLGNDVLSELDWQFDLKAGRATVSAEPLPMEGASIPLDSFMGTPIISAEVGGGPCRLILDTGAELCYFPAEFFRGLAPNGRFRDFNPLLGWFDVDLYSLEARIASIPFTLRSAPIPGDAGMLQLAFRMAGATGLAGIQVFLGRSAFYSPRQQRLALST
ncbi:MAG: hypothetical protein KatS3mg005_0877 [Bryobacteraceae bacterium]|nr:MAG: hypothetical protein KatS3mg005_0877 [Bryobacteraceae bacterium]